MRIDDQQIADISRINHHRTDALRQFQIAVNVSPVSPVS